MNRLSILLLFVLCSFSLNGFCQEQGSQRILVQKKYLQIPVKNGDKMRSMEVISKGQPVRWFQVELSQSEPDWYAYLDLRPWMGDSLEIKVSGDENQVQAWKQVDEDFNAEMYTEQNRGLIHFSPKRGWNNDPNGLVYYQGQYHLFYQSNPYGVNWGNMHWGHAVSKDLVHWEDLDVALYPDSMGTMFSGGAVVDLENTSGLGSKEKPALLLYYTAAEKSWTQGLAYSQDAIDFTKLDRTVIEKVSDGNRDPKVIWYEPAKHWVMVLYVEDPMEQHAMYFYTSKDMKNWEYASKTLGGIKNDRYLYECPELFELPVDGDPTHTKWVLTGANSQYAIGHFDGKRFHPEQERMFSQIGRDFYAAQTFSNEPKGRRIEIGWWRTHTSGHGSKFNQSMSIPMELMLKETDQGIRLVRQPVEELKSLRGNALNIVELTLKAGSANPLANFKAEAAEIRFTLLPEEAQNFQMKVRGLSIQYNLADQEMVIDNVRAHVPISKEGQEFILYVDRTGVELFTDGGKVFMPVNYQMDSANTSFELSSIGTLKLKNLTVYSLNSIWK